MSVFYYNIDKNRLIQTSLKYRMIILIYIKNKTEHDKKSI